MFRTAIGFHDSYVAAPSRKAALEAWGSDKDLFARGVAELVTDPELGAEPLAAPGTIVKRLRGTEAEQHAALPPGKAASPPRPPPSRAALDAAERSVDEVEQRHERARRDLLDREAAIARERRALETAQRKEIEKLERRRTKEAEAFDAAMKRWRA